MALRNIDQQAGAAVRGPERMPDLGARAMQVDAIKAREKARKAAADQAKRKEIREMIDDPVYTPSSIYHNKLYRNQFNSIQEQKELLESTGNLTIEKAREYNNKQERIIQSAQQGNIIYDAIKDFQGNVVKKNPAIKNDVYNEMITDNFLKKDENGEITVRDVWEIPENVAELPLSNPKSWDATVLGKTINDKFGVIAKDFVFNEDDFQNDRQAKAPSYFVIENGKIKRGQDGEPVLRINDETRIEAETISGVQVVLDDMFEKAKKKNPDISKNEVFGEWIKKYANVFEDTKPKNLPSQALDEKYNARGRTREVQNYFVPAEVPKIAMVAKLGDQNAKAIEVGALEQYGFNGNPMPVNTLGMNIIDAGTGTTVKSEIEKAGGEANIQNLQEYVGTQDLVPYQWATMAVNKSTGNFIQKPDRSTYNRNLRYEEVVGLTNQYEKVYPEGGVSVGEKPITQRDKIQADYYIRYSEINSPFANTQKYRLEDIPKEDRAPQVILQEYEDRYGRLTPKQLRELYFEDTKKELEIDIIE